MRVEWCMPWDAVAWGRYLYLALTPDTACASYEVVAEAMPISECSNVTASTEFEPTLSQRATPIQLRNLIEDSCEAHSYKDYHFHVDAAYEVRQTFIERAPSAAP